MDLNPQMLKKMATMKMPFGKYQGRVLMDLP
ncbi:putative quorum-sensing-regulated virulence factor, partial [Pontibacterium sp.]